MIVLRPYTDSVFVDLGIRDITNIDFDYIKQAFQGVKDQLIEKSINKELNEHENEQRIDQILEPIPEHLTGQVEQYGRIRLKYGNFRPENGHRIRAVTTPYLLHIIKVLKIHI